MKRFKRICFVVIVLLLIMAVGLCVSHQVRQSDGSKYDHCLSVLTYNVHCMGWYPRQKRSLMLSFILRQNADIVCLQEINLYRDGNNMSMRELRQAMNAYPYTYYDFKVYGHGKQFGNVVFSRYPLIHKHTISYPSKSNISSRCDVVVGSDTLRLVVNHLESFHFEPTDLSVDSLTSQPINQTSLHRKLRTGTDLRKEQANAIRKDIRTSPYPLVVVGDFNSIPLSYVYLKIRGGMRDAFLQTSRGKTGSTFRFHGIGIRIDYVLCSRHLHPLSCAMPQSDFSDHLPVKATIAW